MRHENITNITAVTKVFPTGQKCVEAVIEYDVPVAAESINAGVYSVEDRAITDVKVKGKEVTLCLDKDDEKAPTFFSVRDVMSYTIPASLEITQTGEISTSDGVRIAAHETPDTNTKVKNEIVDDFIQSEFEGLKYNLFIPKDYDASKMYPLVMFIHDKGVVGKDTLITLCQGVGAVVWAEPEWQKEHACFVLAPQYSPPTIVDDEWHTDTRVWTTKRLIDAVCGAYSIDQTRIYSTGQSMGCMASLALDTSYPDLFAACLLVAGQWDASAVCNVANHKYWIFVSEGDPKAYPGMNATAQAMEKNGARVVRDVWDAKAPPEENEKRSKALISKGANVIYVAYDIDTVLYPGAGKSPEHHVKTWQYAYSHKTAREWIFTQRKGN